MIRKILKIIKRRVSYTEKCFMPCSPPLLIAVNKALRWCVDNNLTDGYDYIEFGIFRGFTLWYAQALANATGVINMRFIGFDSFVGLPSLDKNEIGYEFQKGAYQCTKKEANASLNTWGVDWNKTFLVEGWFEDTLNQKTRTKYDLHKCALCVIDCDLYKSAKEALTFVGPMLCNNSILLFDEWKAFSNNSDLGEQKACSEFLTENSHITIRPFMEFGMYGKGFIVHIKDK